ncbi:MAG: hypothetical protein WAR79_07390 [Melioribacteraceae bacterium]
MRLNKEILLKFLICMCLSLISNDIIADELALAKVTIQEPCGIARSLEYIEIQLQLELGAHSNKELNIVAEDSQSGDAITCQIFNNKVYGKENVISLYVVFPISICANERKIFLLKTVDKEKFVTTDLNYSGTGLDLLIENDFYRANLSRKQQSEAKSHNAGQLNELLIKMDFNQLLFRTENRMHWAPSFQKLGMEYYTTSSGWDNPKHYVFDKGPYLISTQRKDLAPELPEILLTANYYFYAGLPYFKFFSNMDIVNDVTLVMLRNDEMTMDSLFTNIAYQNSAGNIIDLSFSKRYDELEKNPIDNNAPWVCFYNSEKGYAFGSIRIKYDNTNKNGFASPTFLPHTKISDGSEGGKYWNRILIDNSPIVVPEGSNYMEENAYIVFKINKDDKFREIQEWMTILRNPLKISVFPEKIIRR